MGDVQNRGKIAWLHLGQEDSISLRMRIASVVFLVLIVLGLVARLLRAASA
jgi:hypothetical protein